MNSLEYQQKRSRTPLIHHQRVRRKNEFGLTLETRWSKIQLTIEKEVYENDSTWSNLKD